MFLIYCGLSALATAMVYFYIPETKGLPVEELGALFGDEVALHMTSDQMDIVEQSVEDKQGAGQVEDVKVSAAQKV
jgi:hypothetical protein